MSILSSIRNSPERRSVRSLLPAIALALAACGTDKPTAPGGTPGELLVVTSIPDASGVNGSSFVQTADLSQGAINNTDAFEQVFFPYASIFGNTVIVTQHFYGDQAVRYERGTDGRLTEAGRMSLTPGGFGTNVVFASESKAYLSITYMGKILVFDPRTMTPQHEIDLTTLGIARNPSNPEDRNPEPAVLSLRGGKLFVGLQQLVTGFASADGADVAVIDVATDHFEKVIHDDRAASPGRYGYNQTMFVDEHGDLYVYCIASFGAVPGQKAGILRIRSGQTEFDPDYFVDITDANVDVSGGKIGLLNGIGYGGAGMLYAIAEVPALRSNPPDYARDRAFQAVRIDLTSGAIVPLPLPLSNSLGTGVTFSQGAVIFGLSTATGVGLYTYDPTTGTASSAPVLRTAGDPTIVLAFPE